MPIGSSGARSPAGFESHAFHGPGASRLDRWLLTRLRAGLPGVPVRFVLWNGEVDDPPAGLQPVATVTIGDPSMLRRLCWHPSFEFGEGYAAGRIQVAGDLVGLLTAVYRATANAPRRERWRAWRWDAGNTLSRSRSNVHYHYDIGNDFYRLWLDDELLYSCAYYATPEMTLEEAQVAKMDLVCRKLRLQPGERVVEAGCGWGSLALHMARHYGVLVKAYNVSGEQLAYARARAARESLEDRVQFIDADYRDIQGTFDVFVSVGMAEHVGFRHLARFGRLIDRVLVPSGRGFLHFIGRNHPEPLDEWIDYRVFPGAYPPALTELVAAVLQPSDFAVIDVENLRPHYARTLSDWRTRFEANVDRIERMFDARFVRMWRLYLAGSEAAFLTGWLQLFQLLFTRPSVDSLPWTRSDLYAAPPTPGAAP